jgi:DivIVA domain-containing protein
MALDRQSIERRDFPIGRRGYDPDAVDAHLAHLADEVDELKVSSRRHNETLASTAGEQVRAIVEAAEASATEIQRQAEEEARAIRTEAAQDAHTTRDGATTQAHEYVTRVSVSTAAMLQRLNAMESELTTLIDSLRTGANRLNADLQLLEGSFDEVSATAIPRGRIELEPESVPEGEGPAESPALAASPEPEPEPQPEPEPESSVGGLVATDVTEAPSAQAADDSSDLEEAKLIALNMALNGTSREETEKYLAEHFSLIDRTQLLDDVYASVES